MKKTIAIIALVTLIAACAAGCSGAPAAESAAQNTTSADGSELYGNWTKSDWDSASGAEKDRAVLYLVQEAVASEGSDVEVVESLVADAEETLTAEQYGEIEDAITNYFDSAGANATLQDSLKDVRSTISKYVALG